MVSGSQGQWKQKEKLRVSEGTGDFGLSEGLERGEMVVAGDRGKGE